MIFFKVIFGGGLKNFFHITDNNDWDVDGERIDNKKNLVADWIEIMRKQNKTHKFVNSANELRMLNMKDYEHVLGTSMMFYCKIFYQILTLGLFSNDHMAYEYKRNASKEPSIVEMTEKAIELLEKSANGYFLLVESGLIDHGHHSSQAKKAIDEFVVFDEAIGRVLNITSSSDDTLIVVTADHSHTLSLGGNSLRGNEIFGR